MKKHSWYTIIHPDWHEGEPPLFRLVGPAILPDERTCDIYFKPNRKGGHRHNYIKNVLKRIRRCRACGEPIFGGISARLYFKDNSYQNVCRGCLRAIEEDARRHNYETIKEIEMMEADK